MKDWVKSNTKEIKQAKGISANTLKIIAIMGMTLNHVAIIYAKDVSALIRWVLQGMGGVTFPIMAYLLVEGYRHTSNTKRYAMRLFIFACIAELPFRFFLSNSRGNVLFTFLLGFVAIYFYDKMVKKVTKELFFFVFFVLVCVSVFFDWGGIGVLLIFFYYMIHDKWKRVVVPYLILATFFLLEISINIVRMNQLNVLRDIFFLLGCTLSIPLLLHYNGERGKSVKYFFYVYYPAHILVLGILREVLR